MLYEVITEEIATVLTKEQGKLFSVAKFEVEAAVNFIKYRITSYNVCYTKLLRSTYSLFDGSNHCPLINCLKFSTSLLMIYLISIH